MKIKIVKCLFLAVTAAALQGCISIPPLIQVQHKEGNGGSNVSNADVMRRLDSIDRRLDHLERTGDRPPAK